jgi:hypothetical protein
VAGAVVEVVVAVEGEGGAEIEAVVEADGEETEVVEEEAGDSVLALPIRLRRCGSRRRLRSTRT